MKDVIIIGMGPAGLAGAAACAASGLSVVAVDEFMKPGGRLLGQLHKEPSGDWWNGINKAQQLYSEAIRHGAECRTGISVHHLERGIDSWKVYTNSGLLESKCVLLATGAAEYPIPVPGWTLPGVMSVGAAQVMTNVHRVQPGTKGIIIGANILAFAILSELQLAGVHVDRVVLPAQNELSQSAGHPAEVMKSLASAGKLAPSRFLRFGSRLMKNEAFRKLGLKFYPDGGFNINGTRLQLRQAALEIIGDECVKGVRTAATDPDGRIISGTERIYEADFVCIAGGLYPLAELAAVAGCPFKFVPELGGHVPIHSETYETPLDGLFVAGNITGIESGKIAIAQGTAAGLAISARLSGHAGGMEAELYNALAEVRLIRREALIQFHPEIEAGRIKMEQFWEESGDISARKA